MVGGPQISVVMGVYNGERDLPRTLDSILQQEDVDLECVVVDDGSNDGTQEYLAERSLDDPRLKSIRTSRGGLTRALIMGCAIAKGEFIARHDVADISTPRRMRHSLECLESDQALAFVSCWTEFRGPGNEYLYTAKGNSQTASPVWLLDESQSWGVRGGPTHHGATMFRRSLYETVGGYRWQFYYGQDWDLWYRLGAVGTFQTIQGADYLATFSPSALSSQHRPCQEAIARLSRLALTERQNQRDDSTIIEKIAAIRPNGQLPKINHRKGASRGNYFIAECLRKNGDARSRQYFLKALSANPMNWKAALGWVRAMGIQDD